MYIVYKITCIANNKSYIGQTKKTLKRRFKEHCSKARNKSIYRLHQAISKHGEENFTIEEIEKYDNKVKAALA